MCTNHTVSYWCKLQIRCLIEVLRWWKQVSNGIHLHTQSHPPPPPFTPPPSIPPPPTHIHTHTQHRVRERERALFHHQCIHISCPWCHANQLNMICISSSAYTFSQSLTELQVNIISLCTGTEKGNILVNFLYSMQSVQYWGLCLKEEKV